MTNIGTSTWGVILSSGNGGGVPSGTILYFFSNDILISNHSEDKLNHLTAESDYYVNLKKRYYKVSVSDARVVDNTISTLNSYKFLDTTKGLDYWLRNMTKIYFWLTDGTYFDWHIAGTDVDYLNCRLVGDVNINISRNSKTISFRLEESSAT